MEFGSLWKNPDHPFPEDDRENPLRPRWDYSGKVPRKPASPPKDVLGRPLEERPSAKDSIGDKSQGRVAGGWPETEEDMGTETQSDEWARLDAEDAAKVLEDWGKGEALRRTQTRAEMMIRWNQWNLRQKSRDAKAETLIQGQSHRSLLRLIAF